MPSLVDLAEHPAIVFAAYIAALLPLTILYALDFITEKWRTVGDTRRTGHVYLFSSIPPLCFVVFYIHLQRVVKDYKEMAAATSAAIFCIFHILRTIWGLLQLDAFKQWNMRALRCLNNMGYAAPVYKCVFDKGTADDGDVNQAWGSTEKRGDVFVSGTDTSNMGDNGQETATYTRKMPLCFERLKKFAISAFQNLVLSFRRRMNYKCQQHGVGMDLSEIDLELTIDNYMLVNSSLVDNEFRSAELPCRLKKKTLLTATWTLVTRRTPFRMPDHLECIQPLECSVRWLAVFVARFGSEWLVRKPGLRKLERYSHLPDDEKRQVFRHRMGVLAALETTFEEEGEHISLFSPRSPFLKDLSTQQGLQLTLAERAGLPYKCSGYEGAEQFSLENFSSSVREVILGWDRRALSVLKSDERQSVEGMSHYEISCFAKMMSSRLSEGLLRTLDPSPLGFLGIAQQIGSLGRGGRKDFNGIVPTIRPWIGQSLWKGKFVNSSIPQACVHIDNWAALESGRRLNRITSPEDVSDALQENSNSVFLGHKTLEMRAYQYDLSQDITLETRAACGIVFIGSVMESVRAFLAHSVAGLSDDAMGKINWRPTITKKVFPFRCSEQLLNCLRDYDDGDNATVSFDDEGAPAWNIEKRFLWELQSHFHYTVSDEADANEHSGAFAECSALVVLCVLGFPCLEVKQIPYNELEPSPSLQSETKDEIEAMMNIWGNGRTGEYDSERLFYLVRPVHGPQPLSLIVSVNCETGDGDVEVVFGERETRSRMFEWQLWKDSFMGRVKGQAEWRERMAVPEEFQPREEASQSILSSPIKNLSRSVKQWGGWPPLYPRMSTISRGGIFDFEQKYDLSDIERAMDDAAKQKIVRTKGCDVLSSVQETAETLRTEAQSAQGSRIPKSVEVLCRCICDHGDSVALEELFALLRQKGQEFVKKHWISISDSMRHVLESIILSKQKQKVGHETAESAGIDLDQLALCYFSLRKTWPENYGHFQSEARCLFELRDPALLPLVQEYSSKRKSDLRDTRRLAGIFCLGEWKRSGDSFMRLLGESFLEAYSQNAARHRSSLDTKDISSVGYLFENGILRGRQSFHVNNLRAQPFSPYLSVEETAYVFVASSSDSFAVVRKSTTIAARIYELIIESRSTREIDRPKALNRLGLLYLLGKGGCRDLKRSEVLLNDAKGHGSKDALCNLAVLHGFFHRNWQKTRQSLMEAVPQVDQVTVRAAPLRSDRFERPIPYIVSVNAQRYKIWDHSDVCKDPHTSSMNNLAVMYEMRDNFGGVRQSLELYERVVEIDENPIALLNMALLLKLGPTTLRDENRSTDLLMRLQSRLTDIEHMPVLERSIEGLRCFNGCGWSLEVEELDDCAVFVKSIGRVTSTSGE